MYIERPRRDPRLNKPTPKSHRNDAKVTPKGPQSHPKVTQSDPQMAKVTAKWRQSDQSDAKMFQKWRKSKPKPPSYTQSNTNITPKRPQSNTKLTPVLYKIISRFVLNVLFLVSHLSHSSPHLSLSIAQGTLVIAHCLLLISRPGGMRGAIA